MKKKQSRREAEPRIAPGRILLCGALGCGFMLALTFFCSWLMSRELLPPDKSCLLGLVIVALGCFLAALLAARGGCRKLLQGGLSALTAFLLLLICGMLLFSGGVDGGRLLMSLGAAALGGVGGAFLAGALE